MSGLVDFVNSTSTVSHSVIKYVGVLLVNMHYLTGGDYGHRAHILVMIPDGKPYAEFYIPIKDDDDYEANEEFRVTIDPLSLPYGVILSSTADAVVTIVDDDCK